MIAVACDSKGFGVFNISTNTKGDDLWSSPADEGTYEPVFARIIGQKINDTLLRANFTCCKQHVVGSSFSIN